MPSESDPSDNCCQRESLNVWYHLKRVFLPIRSSIPNARERSKLDSGEGSSFSNEALQQFCVWRRSSLIAAIPSVFVSMVLGLINLDTHLGKDSPWNGWGKFLTLMMELSDLFLLIAVIYSANKWHQLIRSTRVVRFGWAISIVLPLLPALFPLEMVIDGEIIDALVLSGELVGIKLTFALIYAITLLPVVITVPGSAVRASLRIRHLMPNSSLPGWILLICAPFYSLVVLIALVLVLQVAGDTLLLLGTLLLVLKPWVYMLRGSLFVGVSTPKVEKQIRTTLYIGVALGVAGIVMVALWALTADINGVKPIGNCDIDKGEICLFNYGEGVKLLFEMIGRILVTTVVFCDFLIAMVLKDWEVAQKKDDLLGTDRHTDFEAFHQVLASQWASKKDKNKSALEDTSKTDKDFGTDPELGANNPHQETGATDPLQPEVVPEVKAAAPSNIPAPPPILSDMEESQKIIYTNVVFRKQTGNLILSQDGLSFRSMQDDVLTYRVGWVDVKQVVLNKPNKPQSLVRLVVEEDGFEEENVVFAVPERIVAERVRSDIRAHVQATKGGAMGDPADVSMSFSHASVPNIAN